MSILNYTIEKVDLVDPEIDLEIRQLMKAAFKSEEILPPGHIYDNINSNASRPSFTLVAKEGGVIIGSNSYIANDFYLGERRYTGYQVTWAATLPDHQGKKVFVNINNEAKRILANEGAGFLYALHNDLSGPIFVGKLGFVKSDAVHTRMTNIPFSRNLYLRPRCKKVPADALVIDEEQLFAHKKKQKGSAIYRVDVNHSFLWGKLEQRKKFGLAFKIFTVGGIRLSQPEDLQGLFDLVFKKYKPGFIEIVSCIENTTNACIKKWKKAPSVNGFVYYNLHMPENIRLNFMFGAIDSF